MTNRGTRTIGRFRVGGTLSFDTASYVMRPADQQLFEHILAGQLCYILTPRQIGKSSLMIHTAERLRGHGFQTAIVDLSGLGTQATAEQWYLGVIKCLAQDVNLTVKPEQWWCEHDTLGPVQRFLIFLHDVLLAETTNRIVIFIDEIDSTLKLLFADDFFAAIRHCYNQRAHNPIYDRLIFVLLGVVAPTDLIKNPKKTPFNIGQAIDLQEFSRTDASPLENGLKRHFPGQEQRILDRIFHWTSGHPYLTQKLCQTVAEATAREWTIAEIDRLVAALFLSDDGQNEDNLQFVNNNVETSPERRQLLRLYQRVYLGEVVKEDERSLIQNRLKLIGLVRATGGTLCVRNNIYYHVFNMNWIRRNTPTNLLRIVTGVAIAAIVLTVIAALLFAYQQRQETIALLTSKYHEDIASREVGAQMYHLGQLCELAQAQAQNVFLATDSQQRRRLFDTATTTTTTPKRLAALFDCLSPALDRQVQDQAQLSSVMCDTLHRLGVSEQRQVCIEDDTSQ